MIFFSSFGGQVPYGLAVRIPGFHPGGPGSTPGMGMAFFFFFFLFPSCQEIFSHFNLDFENHDAVYDCNILL